MIKKKCDNILSVTMLKGHKNMYIMEIDSHLTKSNKTVCNAFVDETNKIIHIYDDLRHKSTTIITEMNRDIAIEFTSLLGLEHGKYRFILYYAPIKKIPFIVEINLKSKSYSEVHKNDIYSLFKEMAETNRPLIYDKEVRA